MKPAFSGSNWADLNAHSAGYLFTSVPAFAKCGNHPAIAALTVVSAFAQTAITARRSENCVAAHVVISPKPDADPAILRLARHMEAAITGSACYARNTTPFDPGAFLEQSGYIDLLARAVEAGANESELKDMASLISKAIEKLSSQISHLTGLHLDRLLRRDLPRLDERPSGPSLTLEWLLAVDRSDDVERPNLLMRRWQALGIYAALSTVLREKPVTLAIDAGRPLKPILMDRLGISAAELRALRGARSLSAALGAGIDLERAVVELKAHGVPLAEWPGRGEPDRPAAWLESPWAGIHRNTIIRVDYVGSEHARDALGALAEDILRPLAVHRATIAKRGDLGYSFLHSFEFSAGLRNSGDRRAFLAVLNSAIIGPRRIKAFQEAVELWHRRVATISAVRHERRTDRPGWPSLCPPWRCERGVHEIVPIASAAGLVEEGNRLDHCVGGYYQQCRSGAVQILSLRRDGTHAATIELKLSGTTTDTLSFQVGQFKARCNRRPDDELHDVLRAFLAALNSGAHPIFRAQLAAHRKRMERDGDYLWSARALPIAHAREVFSLYLPLLPRGAPPDLDTWCERTGLNAAFDRAVALLSRSADRTVPSHSHKEDRTMHPYDHARSSAKIHGGSWSDYFSIHAWFDASKAVQCRFTHRALRHHIEGVAEAVSFFGPTVINSDGANVATEQLGMQHLEEDCTYSPEATVWLIDFDAPGWLPTSEPESAELANASAARFGGDASAYLALHAWFLETRNWSDGPEHLLFRHHAFGIFEAEARFGPVIALDDGKAMPTRVVAERHVQTVLGRVPPANEFLRRIKGERWMLQATSPRKLGLD